MIVTLNQISKIFTMLWIELVWQLKPKPKLLAKTFCSFSFGLIKNDLKDVENDESSKLQVEMKCGV